MRKKPKTCTRCGGSGKVGVQEYDPDTRRWVSVPPVTCGACHGDAVTTGRRTQEALAAARADRKDTR